ncbi:hypothetical protein HPB52_016059 [Rhipicephalus sanguineus]|uniref:Endonuclease/exonuclease/phosphatase domain-containing protein n=1 Tax=Rhipicephalus sanguineus TaxID=34632 RepID=A0A9D4SSH8_RHISA|nr:hypothetical protein HPB52_016059 [Rhipicephalus sanguineus]
MATFTAPSQRPPRVTHRRHASLSLVARTPSALDAELSARIELEQRTRTSVEDWLRELSPTDSARPTLSTEVKNDLRKRQDEKGAARVAALPRVAMTRLPPYSLCPAHGGRGNELVRVAEAPARGKQRRRVFWTSQVVTAGTPCSWRSEPPPRTHLLLMAGPLATTVASPPEATTASPATQPASKPPATAAIVTDESSGLEATTGHMDEEPRAPPAVSVPTEMSSAAPVPVLWSPPLLASLPEDEVAFQVVQSRAAQRRARRLDSAALPVNTEVVGTVLFRPSAPGDSFRGLPRLTLVQALSERPGVADIRVSHKWNIVAADATSWECLEQLLAVTVLQGIPVAARESADRRTSTGFLHGENGEPAYDSLLPAIQSPAPVLSASREGHTVALRFEDPVPPEQVSLFRVRFTVRPARLHPLQCRQSYAAGQTAASDVVAPTRKTECQQPRCVNCSGPHHANTPACPRWQHERQVATIMASSTTALSRRVVRAAVREETRTDRDLPRAAPSYASILQGVSKTAAPTHRASHRPPPSAAPTSTSASQPAAHGPAASSVVSSTRAPTPTATAVVLPAAVPAPPGLAVSTENQEAMNHMGADRPDGHAVHLHPGVRCPPTPCDLPTDGGFPGSHLPAWLIPSQAGIAAATQACCSRMSSRCEYERQISPNTSSSTTTTFWHYRSATGGPPECCAVTVRLRGVNATVASVYIWPRRPWDASMLTRLTLLLGRRYLLCGDMNAHHSAWESRRNSRRLMDVVHKLGLQVLNTGFFTHPAARQAVPNGQRCHPGPTREGGKVPRSRRCEVVDWRIYRQHLDDPTGLRDFFGAIAKAAGAATIVTTVQVNQPVPYIQIYLPDETGRSPRLKAVRTA